MINKQIVDQGEPNAHLNLKLNIFTEALKHAAETQLTAISPQQNKSYLSEHTWNLIEERQQARHVGDHELERTLTRRIKRSANKDEKDLSGVEGNNEKALMT